MNLGICILKKTNPEDSAADGLLRNTGVRESNAQGFLAKDRDFNGGIKVPESVPQSQHWNPSLLVWGSEQSHCIFYVALEKQSLTSTPDLPVPTTNFTFHLLLIQRDRLPNPF